VGLGISLTNVDSQWNPVYNAFHRFFVVETKRFIGSSLNVILTRQTCGRPAASARAGLRKANAKRWEIVFPSEFAICFSRQNVEETEI